MTALSAEQQRMVLDAAVQLFEVSDLQSITLDKLARACGISIFDILRHYQSQENILSAVLERELELMAAVAHAPELRMPGETLRDELHELAGVILQEYRSRVGFLRRLLAQSLHDPQVGALFYRCFIVQGRRLFTEFLITRKDLGELRNDLDAEAAAAVFLAALTGPVLLIELFGGREVETLDDDRLLASISDVFLRGVR
jgi:TetR/AcrR family transcriptional repressor of mexJK operon